MGFATLAVEPVRDRGEPVSSTRIRDAVRTGDFAAAARWLGRPHALAGTVVRGDQRGWQLGWPTANLDVAGLVTPPPGVYAARARLGETLHPAAVNIGVRPTVSAGDARRVEAHLIGFRGDLYGRDLEIEFVRRLREERKFPSLAALAAQIAADVAAARAALS
jgi:riboflavin kinase/FMN adenylyltransferase